MLSISFGHYILQFKGKRLLQKNELDYTTKYFFHHDEQIHYDNLDYMSFVRQRDQGGETTCWKRIFQKVMIEILCEYIWIYGRKYFAIKSTYTHI